MQLLFSVPGLSKPVQRLGEHTVPVAHDWFFGGEIMNILLCGNLTSLAATLVKELVKRKHRLVLASDDADRLGIDAENTIVHPVNPAGNIFRDAMSSYGFDIVIYIAAREEQVYEENDFNTGHQLDGLRNTLELCKRGKLKHFFYISSTEVYGCATDLSEQGVPQPSSINGYTLLAGEQYCRIYHEQFGINTTILRLPNIYGPDEKSGLLYKLITTCNHKNKVVLPSCEGTEVSLLHSLDVTDFLIRAMDEEYTPEALVMNLSSSHPITYSDLAQSLQKYYPGVTFSFPESKNVHTRPAKVSAAIKIYDWIDTYTFKDELESLVEELRGMPHPKTRGLEGVAQQLSKYPVFLKWIELIGGVLLVQYLSQMTGTLIQFKYVDFRLLFVVIMGSIYGIRTGLYAAALVSLSILFTWTRLGYDLALLIYNVGNWLPFALYFTAGLITGYYRDKSENQILNAQKQAKLMFDKYSFLYGVFNDIRALKDEFRERLLGYRDSFGKIFTITRELDQLQEHAVYLRALSILEEQMENKSIAIYSLDSNRSHARLEASSVSLNGSLAKSLDLSDFPELIPHIEQGTIFQNTDMLPRYPAYLVPIFNNHYPFNVPTAMIVIWSVKFEQYSVYYYNRLKVICGLVQASLVRATLFANANHEKTFLPTMRVLTHPAFMDTLRVRMEMKKSMVSDFQLVVMEGLNGQMKDVYSSISESIRANDVIGMGDNGNYYILLSQADPLAASDVIERLSRQGVQCRIVDTNHALLEWSEV